MLIEYIPGFLREIKEYKAIFPVFDTEISNIDDLLKNLLDGQFIYYCNEEYLKLFETIVGIESYDKDIEKRRKAVILKFNEKLPYTMSRLKESLSFICGQNFSLFLIYNQYRLILRILQDSEVLNECEKLLDRMVPANINWVIVVFNTHEIVGKFKHSYLKEFTHSEIKEIPIQEEKILL